MASSRPQKYPTVSLVHETPTFAGVTLVLTTVGLAASYIPPCVRRASILSLHSTPNDVRQTRLTHSGNIFRILHLHPGVYSFSGDDPNRPDDERSVRAASLSST